MPDDSSLEELIQWATEEKLPMRFRDGRLATDHWCDGGTSPVDLLQPLKTSSLEVVYLTSRLICIQPLPEEIP